MRRSIVFASGALFAFSLMALFQDALGREAYVQFVNAHWSEVAWWFWLFPIAANLFSGLVLTDSVSVVTPRQIHIEGFDDEDD